MSTLFYCNVGKKECSVTFCLFIYNKLYIYDSQMALNQGMNRNQSLDRDTMSHLQDMLLEHNLFVPLYRQAAERLREQGVSLDVQVRLTYRPHSDPMRYNVLIGDEIAVILPRENITEDDPDIVVQLRGGSFQRVYDTNPAYVPLHCVHLFPRGEFGWHPNLPYVNVKLVGSHKRVTQLQYYVYHFFQGQGEATTICMLAGYFNNSL